MFQRSSFSLEHIIIGTLYYVQLVCTGYTSCSQWVILSFLIYLLAFLLLTTYFRIYFLYLKSSTHFGSKGSLAVLCTFGSLLVPALQIKDTKTWANIAYFEV